MNTPENAFSTNDENRRHSTRSHRRIFALIAAAMLVLAGTAGAQTFAVLTDIGTNAPIPGPNDVWQTNAPTAASSPDGLNYYFDNSVPPGQTFTTGGNQYGYVLNSVSILTAGNGGSIPSAGQAYLLRIYSVSGSNATLITTYTSTNNFQFTELDWLQWTGLSVALQPNTQYAYTLRRVTSGWENLANVAGDLYPGGEVCLIPTGGGTITFGSSHSYDATFEVGLSLTPLVPVITQQPVSQTVAVGQPASFNVSVLGAVPSYQWCTCSDASYSGATSISNATNSTYSIAAAAAGNATNYFVIVSNPFTTGVTSSVATLSVRLSVSSLAWLGASSFNWDYAAPNWSNIVTAATGTAFQVGDNVQFTDEGQSSSPILLATSLAPGSVNVSSSSNYTFSGSGNLTGPAQLTKGGTGTLQINNANSFTGGTVINNGVLRLGNASALGAATGAVTVAGGTLDVHGVQSPTSLQYNIQGTGYTNAGAIANFGGASQNQNGIGGVNLTGDATVGAVGRWDLNGDAAGSPGLRGNGHNLTKVGSGEIWLIDAGTNSGLGDITVLAGNLGFQGSTGLGDPGKTATILGGSLGFYAVPDGQVMAKTLVLSNAVFNNSGGNVVLSGPVSLIGTNTQSGGYQETTAMQTTFNGPITGSGGLLKNNVGTDLFNGTNSYSGPTWINNGTLMVGANSSLGSSSLIQLGSASALLDVTAPGGLTLGNGGMLSGLGSVNGNVTNNAGSTLSPGTTGPGTLTINGSLTMSNCTNLIELGSDPAQFGNGVNDYISVAGDLNLSGRSTIQISPVAPLSTATPYTILSYGATAPNGGLANLQVVSANPRYTFTLVDPATTPTLLQVSVAGNPTPLVWKGGKAPGPNVWNHTFTNWLNTGTAQFDRFYDGDLVTFDDTGTTNIINVTETNTPGLLTLANNALSYTLAGAGNLAGTLDQEGTGAVTLALSNTIALNFITNNQGTLILNQPVNATLNAMISDNGGGLGTVIKAGTNRLVLTGNNLGYYGTLVVTNGTLQYNNSAALGAVYYPLFVTNGGSLDINNVDVGTKTIAIAGSGYNGLGALTQSTTTWQWNYQWVHNLTLVGDATVGANARWDLAGGGLTGNGFKLTKVGGGQIWLISVGDIGVGDIAVVEGQLGFQQATTMGDPTKTISVSSNASFGIWDNPNVLAKNVALNSGMLYSGGSSNNVMGSVTLAGTNTIQTDADLHLWGNIGGAGGFSKFGGATLWLDGTNTYSGPTRVGSNSRLVVGANTTLGSSSTLQIDGGSTLDVTASGLTLLPAQTLSGSGSAAGNVTVGNGATIAAGDTPGAIQTFAVNGNLTFGAGSTNAVDYNKTTSVASDLLTGMSTVTYGGNLVLANVGVNPLTASDALKLFNATNYTGSFANIEPPTPGLGLQWDTSTLASDGTLRIVSVPVLEIGPISLAGGNLVLSGWGGAAGAGYSVLSQTNLAQPLTNWTILGTGTFESDGSFSFTNAVTPGKPQRFYLIRTP